MAARFPAEPFAPDRLPEGPPAPTGVDPVLPAIFRAAVNGADAYRTTRAGLRRTGPILRLGNRFVPVARYHEIAFVALGSAAVSQALAASTALGETLTQGFVVGPDPLPREVPFRHRVVPLRPAPSPSDGVPAEVLELAGGLGPKDLFIVLLSNGSTGYLAEAPSGLSAEEWQTLLVDVAHLGGSSRDAALVARALGRGAAGGGIARSTRADLATLVVDRGDGADLVGGGPTRVVGPEERVTARAILERTGLLGRLPSSIAATLAPDSSRPTGADGDVGTRPVAIVQPADALRDAGEEAEAKRWHPTLLELQLGGGPDAAARDIVERADAYLRRHTRPEDRGGARSPKGVIGFAATTLAVPEGADEGPAMERFLQEVAGALPWRFASVAALRTRGAPATGPAPGGVVVASRSGRRTDGVVVRPLRMRPGITDVGLLLAVVVPIDKSSRG